MENSEIIESLKSNQSSPPEDVDVKTGEKFVIVLIGEKKFALPELIVQEIIIENEIHYLPFTPHYIRGLINRQGEPYSVVDLQILFSSQMLEAKKFVILRNSVDKMSFIISDILKIVFINSNDIHFIKDQNDKDAYFHSSITHENDEIPVVDVQKIVKRIQDDLE